jgi:hypothetical protein
VNSTTQKVLPFFETESGRIPTESNNLNFDVTAIALTKTIFNQVSNFSVKVVKIVIWLIRLSLSMIKSNLKCNGTFYLRETKDWPKLTIGTFASRHSITPNKNVTAFSPDSKESLKNTLKKLLTSSRF